MYADWLDERDDPRGAYLRAECAWVKPWRRRTRQTADPELRKLAAKLDPMWVARVSRAPMGVCFQLPLFRGLGSPATEEEVNALAAEFNVIFPPEYRAFLLGDNGLSSQETDLKFEILSSSADIAGYARWLFAKCHESNRRCGLFPIGYDSGASGHRTLLGVAYPNTPPSQLFGYVFSSDQEHEPWLDEDDKFIEDRGAVKLADSLCELFANWDYMASGSDDED